MSSRTNLHYLLCDILGSNNVYYQPPESIKLSYPAIVYSLNRVDERNADNIGYLHNVSYKIVLIHKNPDNDIYEKILALPYCRMMGPPYLHDNLYHYAFTKYYK